MPSTTSAVDGNARLVSGDAVVEISRLKAGEKGPMDVGGTPFFTTPDTWVNLTLVETRNLPDDVLLTRYETRR